MAKVIARRALLTDATKTTFSIGSASVGYARFTSLPTDCAEIDVGDALSARVSVFLNASTNAKQAQARLWMGNAVYASDGVTCVGYEAWAIGVLLATSDGLSITAESDTLYSPRGEAAKRLGGTLVWKAATAAAIAAPVSCPPGILQTSETVFSEGASAAVNSVGGAGVLILPHLCRKSLLFIDPACIDSSDLATNAAAAVNFVAEVNRN